MSLKTGWLPKFCIFSHHQCCSHHLGHSVHSHWLCGCSHPCQSWLHLFPYVSLKCVSWWLSSSRQCDCLPSAKLHVPDVSQAFTNGTTNSPSPNWSWNGSLVWIFWVMQTDMQCCCLSHWPRVVPDLLGPIRSAALVACYLEAVGARVECVDVLDICCVGEFWAAGLTWTAWRVF